MELYRARKEPALLENHRGGSKDSNSLFSANRSQTTGPPCQIKHVRVIRASRTLCQLRDTIQPGKQRKDSQTAPCSPGASARRGSPIPRRNSHIPNHHRKQRPYKRPLPELSRVVNAAPSVESACPSHLGIPHRPTVSCCRPLVGPCPRAWLAGFRGRVICSAKHLCMFCAPGELRERI